MNFMSAYVFTVDTKNLKEQNILVAVGLIPRHVLFCALESQDL